MTAPEEKAPPTIAEQADELIGQYDLMCAGAAGYVHPVRGCGCPWCSWARRTADLLGAVRARERTAQ